MIRIAAQSGLAILAGAHEFACWEVGEALGGNDVAVRVHLYCGRKIVRKLSHLTKLNVKAHNVLLRLAVLCSSDWDAPAFVSNMTHFAKNFTLLVILTCPVWAQGPGPGGRGGMMRTPAFTALDSDSDGTISAAEIAKAATALKALDKNGDGKLTEEEVRPAVWRTPRRWERTRRNGRAKRR